GRFYPELYAAMTKLKISHSSEFALAYDELPFHFATGDPLIAANHLPLQIPVHPVCLASFLDAAQSAPGGTAKLLSSAEKARERSAVSAAAEHYCTTARQRYLAGEPVFLYGHPTRRLGRHPEVLRELFATVSEFAAVWRVSMTRFVDWWNARLAVRLSVVRRGEQYVVSVKNVPQDYRLGLEYFRDRHVALIPIDGSTLSFSPSALAYENRGSQTNFHPVRVDRAHGLKDHIRHLIDWECVTPVEEIGATTWRHYAKRALRRWWRP
ncbi:MAG: hypothetical protein JXM70_23970, partial [Pirellulales bacterium]|nr:hypothetical protein [Pirellulales bacterium]